jgi:hypothetical protein
MYYVLRSLGISKINLSQLIQYLDLLCYSHFSGSMIHGAARRGYRGV